MLDVVIIEEIRRREHEERPVLRIELPPPGWQPEPPPEPEKVQRGVDITDI